MTPEERAAHCRAIGTLGGRATLARHGPQHMSEIGKLGFAAAMESVGGHVVAQKLGASYQAKYGRPITRNLTREEYREKRRTWNEARKLFPNLECVNCGAQGAQRHHPNGVSNGNDVVEGRCKDHHKQWHREQYREKRRAARHGRTNGRKTPA